MIRYARRSDYNQIRRLWDEAFTDKNYANWYFTNVYREEYTLVYDVNDIDGQDSKVVAMLARIPYEINNFGKVTYIYGACTDIEYRNRGIMSKLLAHSEEIDRATGIMAIILIPENKELFKFYDKLGYNKYFYRYLINKEDNKDYLEVKENLLISNNNEENRINKGFLEEVYINVTSVKPNESKIIYKLNNLYNHLYSDKQSVVRDTDYFLKQITMYNENQGKVYIFYDGHNEIKGYVFGYTEEDFIVTELVYEDSKVRQEIINQLIMFHKSIRILNELQGNYKIKYGSIKILQKCKIKYKLILNLMLD